LPIHDWPLCTSGNVESDSCRHVNPQSIQPFRQMQARSMRAPGSSRSACLPVRALSPGSCRHCEFFSRLRRVLPYVSVFRPPTRNAWSAPAMGPLVTRRIRTEALGPKITTFDRGALTPRIRCLDRGDGQQSRHSAAAKTPCYEKRAPL
jgi:hypothetical protein